MAGGCRDCARCTESGVASMILMPFRVLGWICGGFLFGMFRKKCPQCRHFLSSHTRIAGKFAD